MTREEWKDWAAVMAAKELKSPDPRERFYEMLRGMSYEAMAQRQLQGVLSQQFHICCTCFACEQNRDHQSNGILGPLVGSLGGWLG